MLRIQNHFNEPQYNFLTISVVQRGFLFKFTIKKQHYIKFGFIQTFRSLKSAYDYYLIVESFSMNGSYLWIKKTCINQKFLLYLGSFALEFSWRWAMACNIFSSCSLDCLHRCGLTGQTVLLLLIWQSIATIPRFVKQLNKWKPMCPQDLLGRGSAVDLATQQQQEVSFWLEC